MKKRSNWRRWVSYAAGGWLMVLGGCGLSDQQLTAISQSVLTTGLNTLVSQLLTSLFSTGAAA